MALIHEVLTASARKYPDKQAVVCGFRSFSYSEIENASNRLANYLNLLGIGYRDRIGIFSNKDIEEIIVIFAILKVGAIFVHINPQFKKDQLSHLIADCDIKLLFVSSHKATILNKTYPITSPITKIISLSPRIDLNSDVFSAVDFLDNILNESPGKVMRCDCLTERDIASIIYTSGSTGKPKGVIVTHKIFMNSTIISSSIFKNRIDDRLISVTPLSFDGALSQLFTAFLVSATLVLQQSTFQADIVKTLIRERITGFHAVPTLWIMMLQKFSPFKNHD